MPHQAYVGNDGREWPSVTEITGIAPKPWLLQWYRASVMKSGKKGWLANEKLSEKGKAVGTETHTQIETILRGGKSDNPLALACIKALLEYAPDVEIESIEMHMVDTQYKVHGSLDFVARIGGTLMVGDWKTNNKPDKYHAAQLSAYDHMFGGSGKGLLITVDKKAKEPIAHVKEIDNLPAYFGLFKHLLAVWKYDKWGELED